MIPPRHSWIQGNVCSDGSALLPELPLFTRAAWALVVVNDAGQVLASACGPLEHGLHTIYGAEVFAILMALRLSGPDPVVCATDCESVLKVWDQGTEADLSSVPYAEFWEKIQHRRRDREGSEFSLVKVPAHKSWVAAFNQGVPYGPGMEIAWLTRQPKTPPEKSPIRISSAISV